MHGGPLPNLHLTSLTFTHWTGKQFHTLFHLLPAVLQTIDDIVCESTLRVRVAAALRLSVSLSFSTFTVVLGAQVLQGLVHAICAIDSIWNVGNTFRDNADKAAMDKHVAVSALYIAVLIASCRWPGFVSTEHTAVSSRADCKAVAQNRGVPLQERPLLREVPCLASPRRQ
jgi:hypothetical protein